MQDGSCRYRSNCKGTDDKGHQDVGKSEESLQHALASVGPIAVAMDTNNRRFW